MQEVYYYIVGGILQTISLHLAHFLWFTRNMTSWLAIVIHNEFSGATKYYAGGWVMGNNESSYNGLMY